VKCGREREPIGSGPPRSCDSLIDRTTAYVPRGDDEMENGAMSGFLDRAKQMAEQGMNTGKQKVEEVQVGREATALLKRLGAAYWAEQRDGGSHEEVVRALTAIDEHVAAHGDAALRT